MAAPRRPRFGIRLQLLGLFGLLLLTGATVLVLDEIERQHNQRALLELKDESLAGLRRIKAVSDAYGLDVVDTTFRVRNYLISWEEGAQVLANARLRIREHWSELERLPLTAEQETLFAQVRHARPDLQIVGFRGNVETRLRKLAEGGPRARQAHEVQVRQHEEPIGGATGQPALTRSRFLRRVRYQTFHSSKLI